MILVKSLIVIFLLLFFFKYYDRFVTYMSNKFDGREGFANANELGAGANAYEVGEGANANEVGEGAYEVEEEEYEELSYNVDENQPLMAEDAKLMGELQDKMKELLELSDKATNINNDIKKIK